MSEIVLTPATQAVEAVYPNRTSGTPESSSYKPSVILPVAVSRSQLRDVTVPETVASILVARKLPSPVDGSGNCYR